MLMRSMTRLIFVMLLGLGALGQAACSEKGSSLVLLAIDADQSLSALKSVDISLSKGGNDVASKTFAWKADSVNHVGVFVPKGVTGAVDVRVTGKDAMGTKIADAMSISPVAIVPGGSSVELSLYLMPSGSGPGGTGGAMGTGGSGPGTGGVGPGTGGSGAGTGGASGTGGTPATGGSGTGTGGTGTGGAAPGSGGRGTGGAAGAAGPTWRGAKTIEPDVLVANWTPAVAVDGAGNAVVVYRHGTGIRATRYNAANDTWSAPVGVETRSGGQAYSPSIAVDKNGAWLVIWQQDESMSIKGLWQSTSTDGMTWTAPTAIATTPAFSPVLAMNKDGVAVAAWYGRDPTAGNYPCTASVRTAGTWSAPMVMKAANTANGYPEPVVAVGGTGEAFVVWHDVDDGTAREDSIYLRRYTAGAWSAATLVESYDGGGADTQSVAANASGQAIIAWRQTGATVDEMWARRYSPGGTLSAPVMLGQGTWISWDPLSSATIDDTGVSTVAWTFEVQKKFNVYVNRAAHTQAFPMDPTAIETDNMAAAVNNSLTESAKAAPVLGSDAAGNVVLVWRKSTGTRFDLYGRRFSAGAWGSPSLLEDQNTTGVSYPVVAVGPNGTAVTAWYYENDNRIWANVLR
jgi:hypothetical protein